LGGFISQTYNIDKGIIKIAKDSLLGQEENPKPFYSFTFPRSLTSLRIPFLTIFLLSLAGMILISQGHHPSLENVKNFVWGRIQEIYFQIPGTTLSSVSALSLDKGQGKDSSEGELTKNLEVASQEGLK
jgi:hypothetical protein